MPIKSPGSHSRISLDRIRAAQKEIDPIFLNSPQYNCEPLSEELGVALTLKVETINPIRSFKGRGAEFLLSYLGDQKLICASAGNFGQAMAFSCRKRGVKLKVYAATTANPLKVERMKALGAEVILDGNDFDKAKEIAKAEAAREGIIMIEDGLAIETIEGAGTMGLELLKAGPFDAILVPLGNGALFNGLATVFKELSPSTRMVAVQAEGAPAMIHSWQSGSIKVYEKIHTIADGIGVRMPIPQTLTDMAPLIDEGILVKEESIIKGMKLLYSLAGLITEPSAAVGIAALLENTTRFSGKRVATIICGSNITPNQFKEWVE